MDRRKLKKLPSLLGSNLANQNRGDDTAESPNKKDRLTSSKSRARSPDENLKVLSISKSQLPSSSWKRDNVTTSKRSLVLSHASSDESEDDTFISKTKKKNKSSDTPTKSATKLGSQLPSSGRTADNVTTRRRLISVSPVCGDALSDISEDDVLVSMTKKKNTSLDTPKKSASKSGTQKERLSSSKTRAAPPDEDMDLSSPEGSAVSSHEAGEPLTSTQLSSSSRIDNVTSRRRLMSVSPVCSDALWDGSEDEVFVSKSKKKEKSIDTSRRSKTASNTPEKKRKRSRSGSFESDSRFAKTPEEKLSQSSRRSSPRKSIGGGKKSTSPNSSITHFTPEAVSSAEEDGYERGSGTRKSSSQKNGTPLKKKRGTSSGRLSVAPVSEEDGSADEDIFADVLQTSSERSQVEKSAKSQTVSSPKKKGRERSDVGQRRSDEFVHNTDRITRSQRHKKSPNAKNVVHHLKAFFKSAGILLLEDGPNLLCENWRTIVGKSTELLKSEEYDKDEIVKQFQDYIDDVNNLQRVLNQTMVNEPEALIDESTESVARILLNVPSLQNEIAMSLLDRLALAIFIEESLDSVPWSGTLLRQFKFLEEIVEPVNLVNKLGDLLESAQPCFQSEIISYLPDIIIDAQHHAVGEVLRKLMNDNPDLIAVILDCISRLTLSADYVEDIKDKTLDLLRSNPLQSTLPAMTRFILGASLTPEAQVRALTAIRAIDMQPLNSINMDECFTNQVLTVGALKTAFQVSKKTADMSFAVVQGIKKDPKPLDLVMLLLIFYSNSMKKKNVKTLIRNRVRSGFYRISLLNALYYDYKQVARDLQSVAIPVAAELLKAGDRVHSEFAIEWFRLLFLSQGDAMHKQQEVLAKIIRLTSVGTETSKNALAILSKLAHKDEEKEHLQKHSHHLRTLLEEVDELDLEEVATVSDLLHGLCVGSHSTSDALQTDLDIVLYKQLASCKPVTKCKGVLGALMAIKYSAAYPRTRDRAAQLFEQVVKAVRSCAKSRALFYDRMAEVLGTAQNLDEEFLQTFTEHFTAELTSLYLMDIKDYDGPLSAQFSLNSEVQSPPEVEYGISFGEGKYGSAVSALFRLIKACYLRAGNDDLSEIDALLACPVFLPKDLHEPDAAVLDQVFHCINWFREILSGFVTYTDNATQKMLLKRLEHLMTLQAELSTDLVMAEARYQPPLAYFHNFPSPPFVRIEKKAGKRGNKTVAVNKSQSLTEWSGWESGSLLIRKNPAYFRRLDAKIAHLLDFSMVVRSTQNATNSVTIVQVCFIIQELLGMLENEASQMFMKDLVGLLPKVCAKLDQVTEELREKTDSQNRECLRLILSLLTVMFNWKGFHNFANNALLREALRFIASQSDATNTLLRTCKELVAQSCSYVESLTEVASHIPVAIALVNLFEALIQHSDNHSQQHKQNLAKMAFGFLCLDWTDDKSSGAAYRAAVASLLKIWFNNEPDPLDTVVTLLNWLPRESAKLVKPQDSLSTILSINRTTFNLLFKQIFVGLIKGVKISLAKVKRDSERINIWNSVATGIKRTVEICQSMELKANWIIFLQHFSLLLKFFIDSGMPVLEHNLKHHMEEVTGIVKDLQVGTRYLHVLCCHTTVTGDVTLAKFVPTAKSALERLVFSVKGMLVLNNSTEAFWMGNLINKDMQGHTIDLEGTEESTTVSASSDQTDVSEELLTDVSDEGINTEDETE